MQFQEGAARYMKNGKPGRGRNEATKRDCSFRENISLCPAAFLLSFKKRSGDTPEKHSSPKSSVSGYRLGVRFRHPFTS